MSKFTLTINTDNDAFYKDPAAELARLLKEVIEKLPHALQDHQGHTQSIKDINGNRVGSFKYHWDSDK